MPYENSSLGNCNKVGLSLLTTSDELGLIILDESLNGLDSWSKKFVLQQLNLFSIKKVCPIIIVSHSDDLSLFDNSVTKINMKELT